jgi:hypothetical protein
MRKFTRSGKRYLYLQQPIIYDADGSRWTGLLDVLPGERGYEKGLPYKEAQEIMIGRLMRSLPRLGHCRRCGAPISSRLSIAAEHGPVCARKRLAGE